MRLFRTEVWSYAVLMIILFCIASVAVWFTLEFIEEQVSGREFHVIAAAIWSLTMGFMLIAASFGIWAIQFAGEVEGRRRVGRLVDAMNYISDGLLVADDKGRISGSNPAAREMAGDALDKKVSIVEAFPCLEESDLKLLLDSGMPNEVEHAVSMPDGVKVWRFRSHPADGMHLLLVSDVTRTNIQRLKSRQAARLQLIGEIARGVAHDFNNLLCGISGYASLLSRFCAGSKDADDCAKAIAKSVERGISMASHLLTLSRDGGRGKVAEKAADHIEAAGMLLRDSLPEGWQVDIRIQSQLPPVTLTGAQMEQLVANLGFLATDEGRPGVLRIEAGGMDMPENLRGGNDFAGIVVVGVVPREVLLNDFKTEADPAAEHGVIESVLMSMLQEAGGSIKVFLDGNDRRIFCVKLPVGNVVTALQKNEELPDEIKAYLAGWHVVFASLHKNYIEIHNRMQALDMSAAACDSIAALLSAIESANAVDGMIIDSRILGTECKGILRAVLKLRPMSAIVVISDNIDNVPRELCQDIVFLEASQSPDSVIASLIEAKTMAMHRRSA